ncbi:methyl-accepting chemotaxis protein [Halomonas vilamensis]|uniref:Methyl-accepting chemotaxis protein n=1 Tax=Vreelandella vilamensis TaxID=531309 RepID=A0ABU1H735_9GAMM|nr:methyl-accepting chemotaxis protein [Halomonas vilamensis]MDR5900112.1 methyl-accepting chemotaxis protein [Halomonas vilamensis]
MLKNIKIAHQLAVLVSVFTIAILIIGALGITGKKATLDSLKTVYEDRVVPVKQLSTIVQAYAVNIVDTAHKVSNGNIRWEQAARNLEEAKSIIAREWEAYLDTELVASEERLVAELKPLLERANEVEARLEDIIQRQNSAALNDLIVNDLYQSIDPVSETFDQLMTVQLEVAEREYRQGLEQYDIMRTTFIVAILAVLAIGIFLAWYMISRLSRQLGAEPAYVANIASQVANQNLDIDINTRSGGDDGSVLFAMKRMVDNLSSVIQSVRDSSNSIHVGTREIANGNADLSSRTEEQASALQQTAASMEEMTATVKQNAENAKQASGLAQEASDTAERGGDEVNRVVKTMHDIAGSSQQVSDIIGVIDSISFQTNILALNASVEAARAGEQGRGFAVVASEVRNLASRSAEAAKEIRSLIESSVAQVQQGSALVEQTGNTMTEVVSAIRRVTDIMDEISAASEEQSSGIEQVSQAVGQMDQVTQQNAALVQQASSASASLDEQADRLEAAVAVFNLANNSQDAKRHEEGFKLESDTSEVASPAPKQRFNKDTSSKFSLQNEWEAF